MSSPRDRWGVFLVPSQFEPELRRQVARVEAAFIGEHGEVGPRGWYEAQHELFDRLAALATHQRVVDSETAADSVAQLVAGIDGPKRGTWEAADAAKRRELARARAAKIGDRALRAAVEDLLSQAADADGGLWIEAEASLPNAPVDEESSPVDLDEFNAKFDELVVEGDHAWLRAERAESSHRVSFCELSNTDAHHAAEPFERTDEDDIDASARASEEAAGRSRVNAISRDEEHKRTIVAAIERLCQRAPVPSLARHIYDAAQARQLLDWLETQRPGVGRDRLLTPLRTAVGHRHAFAIVFDTV